MLCNVRCVKQKIENKHVKNVITYYTKIKPKQSYYNLRKDTGRQPRTLFQSANYFAVSRPILTKSGTDNLSGSEKELAMSEM